nr:ester cyclase [Nannocystis sp. ILAH1]
MQLRVRHAEELRVLAEELAQARQQRDQAIAENAQRAAQVAEADSRLDRLQHRFAAEFQRVTELAAQAGVLERDKAVVRALQEAVRRRDWPAVETLLAPGFVQRDPSDNRAPVDRAGFMNHLLLDAEQNPAIQEHIDFLIAEEDLVAVHATTSMRIFRVAGGQIAEAWGGVLACSGRAASLRSLAGTAANGAARQTDEQAAQGGEASAEASRPLRDR